MGSFLTGISIRHPRTVIVLTIALTLALAALAALPSLWPARFPRLAGVQVDTDPENMLSEDEVVRVFHHRMKETLALYDMVVVGVVNEEHPDGVFNAESLRRVWELTEYAKTLHGEAIGEDDPRAGVVEAELLAPSTVDNIEQAGPGVVRFEWLMSAPPTTDAEARAIRDKALRIPFLRGTLVSEDGKALAVYLPLTAKDLSHQVYTRLRSRIAQMAGDERWFITGLPVAEDTFGVEMFVQMAISAPAAMIVIFLLLLFFFRKLTLIASPMILAMVTVICVMALLVVTGNTIHIMSSMIPIFLMPIAVLDSVHILSEFFDRHDAARDRRETVREVMATLFLPMLFTSLTSIAGFASLAMTPIPPVRVFGIFVAAGILLAWFLTVTFIPAYIVLLPERSLRRFGLKQRAGSTEAMQAGLMGRVLLLIGRSSYRRPWRVLLVSLLLAGVAAWGITRIQINDNPTRWFRASHPIRVADRVLNEHFGGTYMAYLALLPGGEPPGVERLEGAGTGGPSPGVEPSLPAGLGGPPSQPPAAESGASEPGVVVANAGGGPDASSAGGRDPAELEIFKQPEALRYLERLQAHLLTTEAVGKSSSLADIVKTVHRELIDGSEAAARVPDSPAGVAQTLVQYQSSHRPGDVWHFVTPDYRASSIWVQLKSGDNKDMERVVAAVDAFVAAEPPPFSLEPRWFGLTYINVIWQEKMVTGMLNSFLGSFVVVLIMMVVLLRSLLWGLLSMIPLTLTIGLIYGVIGIVGRDYDMPVAVLSALTLGLAVDFAIHFLARARELHRRHGDWGRAIPDMFGEPARAIARNVIVIAVGFVPLLLAPLVPYNTVGVFLAAILVASGLSTLMLLTALLTLMEPVLFRGSRRERRVARPSTIDSKAEGPTS